MKTYVVLIRGINVGGKNKVTMADLRQYLEELGYSNVSTYIASGNVILQSDKQPAAIKSEIERMLPERFALDDDLIMVLVLSHDQLRSVITNKPKGFGDEPNTYHSDAIFLIGIGADEALPVFEPREGVDMIWPGDGVIYSRRVSELRVKSRLNKIIGTPVYKYMTIRSWNTTTKLLDLLDQLEN